MSMLTHVGPALGNFAVNESQSGSTNQGTSLPEEDDDPDIITLESNAYERQQMRYPEGFDVKCQCRAGKNQGCCDNIQEANPKTNRSTGLDMPATVQLAGRLPRDCGFGKKNAAKCSMPKKGACPFASEDGEGLEPLIENFAFREPGYANIEDNPDAGVIRCAYRIHDEYDGRKVNIDAAMRAIDTSTAQAINARLSPADSVKFRRRWCFLDTKTEEGKETIKMFPNGPPESYHDDPLFAGGRGFRVPMCNDLVATTAEGEAAANAYCAGKSNHIECACAHPSQTVADCGAGASIEGADEELPEWQDHYNRIWKTFHCGGERVTTLLPLGPKKCWFSWCDPDKLKGKNALIPKSQRPFRSAADCPTNNCLNLIDLTNSTLTNSNFSQLSSCVETTVGAEEGATAADTQTQTGGGSSTPSTPSTPSTSTTSTTSSTPSAPVATEGADGDEGATTTTTMTTTTTSYLVFALVAVVLGLVGYRFFRRSR